MKNSYKVVIVLMIVVLLQGCSQGKVLENLTLPLILGFDLDEENNLVIFLSGPIFSKEAKENTEIYDVKSQTIVESKGRFDAKTIGLTTNDKIQVVLVGKKILQQDNWFRLFDAMYRDPTYSMNAKVVAVDGSVSDLINYQAKDKPRLAIQLIKKLETANQRSITVNTTLQELHRQMFEKGITPAITEIKKDQDIIVKGTTLLDIEGKYATSLDIEKNKLLPMLQHQVKEELSITMPIPDAEKPNGMFSSNEISFSFQNVSRKLKVSYLHDKFHFDINLKIPIYFKERLFLFDLKNNEKEMERMIEEQLEIKFKDLVSKFQEYEIDPIGLGLYARAYKYDEWKKVQDHWGRAFKKADIKVSVKVDIQDKGIIK